MRERHTFSEVLSIEKLKQSPETELRDVLFRSASLKIACKTAILV